MIDPIHKLGCVYLLEEIKRKFRTLVNSEHVTIFFGVVASKIIYLSLLFPTWGLAVLRVVSRYLKGSCQILRRLT